LYTESSIDVFDRDTNTEGEYISVATEFGFHPNSIPDVYYGPAGKVVDTVYDLLNLAEILRCSD
jgi:hypothetical protein